MEKDKKFFVAILKINSEFSIYGDGNCKNDAIKDAIFQYNIYKKFIEPESKEIEISER